MLYDRLDPHDLAIPEMALTLTGAITRGGQNWTTSDICFGME
jgi:hypothetical protein